MTTTAMTLDDIYLWWLDLEAMLDEARDIVGDHETEEIERQLAVFDFTEKDKLDGYAAVLERLEDDEAAHKARADEYLERAKRARERRDWLKRRLGQYMTNRGVKELSGHLRRARFVGNGGQAPLVIRADAEPRVSMFGRAKEWDWDRDSLRKVLEDPTHPYHADAAAVAEIGKRGQTLRLY